MILVVDKKEKRIKKAWDEDGYKYDIKYPLKYIISMEDGGSGILPELLTMFRKKEATAKMICDLCEISYKYERLYLPEEIRKEL